MKEWIKKLTDNDISNLYKDKKTLLDVPKDVRKKVLSFIEEKEKQPIIEEKEKFAFFKAPFLKPAFALIIVIVLLLPVIWFINTNFNKTKINLISKSVYGNKNITVQRNSKNFNLTTIKSIINNDIIKSDPDSKCELEFSEKIKMVINENSELKIINIYSDNKLNFYAILNYGKVLFGIKELENDSSFKIRVDHYLITVVGTEFLIEKTDEYIYIAVNEGKVKVEDMNNKENIYLIEAGNSIKIVRENIKTENFNEEIKKDFDFLTKSQEDEQKNNLETKEIKDINIEEQKEEKNKNTFFSFFKKEEKIQTKEKLTEEKWVEKEIYKSESSENILIGICYSDKNIVTQFNNGLISFKKDGEFIWGKFYKKKMFSFTSIPVIINNKIYAFSGGNKIIIYDINNGKELKFFNCPETLNEEISIINYKDKLFFPLNRGIYVLETDFDYFQSEPLIVYNKAKCHYVNNNLYILSEYDNKIRSYNLKGKLLWEYKSNDMLLKAPIFINQNLYLIDIKNNILKINQFGKLADKIQIDANIKSFNYNKDVLFILSEDYKLYEINLINLKINKILRINNNNKNLSLFDNYEISDNTFLLNSQDQLLVFDIDKESITNKINISNAKTISRIDNNKLIITTDICNIFLIEKNIITIE